MLGVKVSFKKPLLSLIVKSQESSEVITDMFMVALMKISKLLFTLFEIDDQSFSLPPLALSAKDIFFSLLSKGKHHKLATLGERFIK